MVLVKFKPFRKSGLPYGAHLSLEGEVDAVGIVDDIVTSPVVDGSTVFVANASGRITALNLDNGERIWGNLEPLEISGRRVIAISGK